MEAAIYLVSGIIFCLLLRYAFTTFRSKEAARRLALLDRLKQDEFTEAEEIDWKDCVESLAVFSDRLGHAGFIEAKDRKLAVLKLVGILFLSIFVAVVLSIMIFNSFAANIFALFLGAYFGVALALVWLNTRKTKLYQGILFNMPIVLESIILLVESGLGILPAIQRIVETSNKDENPAIVYLERAYQLSASGVPFEQALSMVSEAADHKVLRHVLMHLDISQAEGGELVPSLQNLSSHSHTEWKLSVEARVKRLENLVVFPVFVSVIGLMFLTASVPLIPVLDLHKNLSTGSAVSGEDLTSPVTEKRSIE